MDNAEFVRRVKAADIDDLFAMIKETIAELSSEEAEMVTTVVHGELLGALGVATDPDIAPFFVSWSRERALALVSLMPPGGCNYAQN